MGEQQVFVEGHTGFLGTGADLHGQRQAGQLCIRRPARAVKGQRHQARAAFDERDVELLRQPVAKVGGADLGNGQPARGNDQRARLHRATVSINLIAGSA